MNRQYFYLLILLILCFAGCTTHKKITYLNDLTPEATEETFFSYSPNYKVQKSDILYVNIFTLDPEINEIFNPLLSSSANLYLQYETTQYLYGYTINDSGNIRLPAIGEVNVINKTFEEIEYSIEEKAIKFIKDPKVTVKLLSYSFSVLGEVNMPGTYPSYNSRLNIFEALSKAGDISEYGNIKKIRIIRTNRDTVTISPLDLTSKNIINTEYYYILPNDVIYVEPRKSKTFRLNVPTISVSLGAISTFILILNYFDKK